MRSDIDAPVHYVQFTNPNVEATSYYGVFPGYDLDVIDELSEQAKRDGGPWTNPARVGGFVEFRLPAEFHAAVRQELEVIRDGLGLPESKCMVPIGTRIGAVDAEWVAWHRGGEPPRLVYPVDWTGATPD